MNIIFKELSRKSKEYKYVKKLYDNAFPKEERVPFFILMNKSRKDNVKFYSVFDSEAWIGFAYIISYKNISYLFYFAISDEYRGKGYGSATLNVIRKMYSSSNLFLAIEELDEKYENYLQRVKRKEFYERNGFHFLGQKMVESGVIYDLLGTENAINAELYSEMMKITLGRIFYKKLNTYIKF